MVQSTEIKSRFLRKFGFYFVMNLIHLNNCSHFYDFGFVCEISMILFINRRTGDSVSVFSSWVVIQMMNISRVLAWQIFRDPNETKWNSQLRLFHIMKEMHETGSSDKMRTFRNQFVGLANAEHAFTVFDPKMSCAWRAANDLWFDAKSRHCSCTLLFCHCALLFRLGFN